MSGAARERPQFSGKQAGETFLAALIGAVTFAASMWPGHTVRTRVRVDTLDLGIGRRIAVERRFRLS